MLCASAIVPRPCAEKCFYKRQYVRGGGPALRSRVEIFDERCASTAQRVASQRLVRA